MKNWFESLEPRERLFVGTAGIFLAIAVFYLAIWMPLDAGQQNAAAGVENWRNSLAELRMLEDDLQSADASENTRAGMNESLVVIVDNTLREHGLYDSLQRSQPTTTDGIRLEFENVAFDSLVVWLGDLGAEFNLHVQSGSFASTSEDAAGRVNATLILER